MPEPSVHPEFPWSLPTLVTEGILAMLRADAPLAAYMTSIRPHEREELFLEGNLAAPELGVLLTRWAETRTGSSRKAEMEIENILSYVHHAGLEDEWLRARVVDHVHTVLLAEAGVVRCPFDTPHYQATEPLTEALLTFGAVITPFRLASGDLLVTPIRATFRATFSEATRRVFE